MKEEEKIMQGKLFEPVEQSLVEMKRVSHNLCMDYNRTYEHETQKRAALIKFWVAMEKMFISKVRFILIMENIRK